MTDEQIMQGLKWCYQVEGSCGDCPYRPDDIKKAKCHDRLGNDVIGLIERQKAEIDRLTDSNKRLHEGVSLMLNNENGIELIKAEAIKEFVEKLKAIGTKEGSYNYVSVFEIDKVAKEMVGDSNV